MIEPLMKDASLRVLTVVLFESKHRQRRSLHFQRDLQIIQEDGVVCLNAWMPIQSKLQVMLEIIVHVCTFCRDQRLTQIIVKKLGRMPYGIIRFSVPTKPCTT